MEQSGRTGITFDQVAALADTITARGDRPTLRGVRAELGSGSMGTIQKHLTAWQGQRRQIVTSTASLPAEIQRVILAEMEREVLTARAELESELAAIKGDRDTLADDNESQTEQLELQAKQIEELTETKQQQLGRIAQLEASLASAAQATEQERAIAEQGRQSLVKAELRLEALPKVEAEVERLRAALEASQARCVDAEQLAAVTGEKLAGVEARLADAQGQLQALPKVEAEKEQLRAALDAAQGRATAAEQLAAVTAEKLSGVESRLNDAKEALAEQRTKSTQ